MRVCGSGAFFNTAVFEEMKIMDMKYLTQNFYIMLFAFLAWSNAGNAQSELIQFFYTNGTQQEFLLSDVRKIDYSPTQLRLYQTDGTIIAWNFDLLDHYRYTDLVTKIDNVTALQNAIRFDVFPNPVSGLVTIHYELLNKQEAELSVISIDERVIEKRRTSSSQKGSWQIDLSQYPSGQYIALLSCRNFNMSRTVIKM